MKKILFVTTNQGKIDEARNILGQDVEPISLELDELQSFSFEEVVKHKVTQAFEKVKMPIMVEDSGIIFESLINLPGVFTKWFYQSLKNEGMVKMLSSYSNKNATAISYVGYFDGINIIIEFGEIAGRIVGPIGDKGFGWDPIFMPDGFSSTFAQMDSDLKNSFSMRKIALLKVAQRIKKPYKVYLQG